jgi:hypothetical protein
MEDVNWNDRLHDSKYMKSDKNRKMIKKIYLYF